MVLLMFEKINGSVFEGGVTTSDDDDFVHDKAPTQRIAATQKRKMIFIGV